MELNEELASLRRRVAEAEEMALAANLMLRSVLHAMELLGVTDEGFAADCARATLTSLEGSIKQPGDLSARAASVIMSSYRLALQAAEDGDEAG